MKRKELDRAEYLKMCVIMHFSEVDKQREDFKRLGFRLIGINLYVTFDTRL